MSVLAETAGRVAVDEAGQPPGQPDKRLHLRPMATRTAKIPFTRAIRPPQHLPSCCFCVNFTCCPDAHEEHSEQQLSWFEVCCISDPRLHKTTPLTCCVFGTCCPIMFPVWYLMGTCFSNNYFVAALHGGADQNFLFPCGFGCYDARKVVFLRHSCCCGLCGTHGPNVGYGKHNVIGLHGAAEYGFLQYAKLQLCYGDSVDGGGSATTPLHLACKNSHVDMIKLLVLNGAQLDKRDEDGLTVMHLACKNNLKESVSLLVSYGAAMHDDLGDHPVDLLPEKDPGIVQQLARLQGIIIMDGGSDSFSKAIAAGHIATVKSALNTSGAFSTLPFDAALELAVSKCRKDVALLLLRFRRDEKARPGEEAASTPAIAAPTISRVGAVLMRWAAEEGEVSIISQIDAYRVVDLDVRFSNNNTLLHVAARCAQFAVVELLIERGASISATNDANLTPLENFPVASGARQRFYVQSAFSYSLLSANAFSFWFHLVLVDLPGLSRRVQQYATDFTSLVRAKDVHGHLAEEVATAANMDAIRAAYLWHGRYRLMDWRPEHTSATCFVFRAWDELDLDDVGAPTRVALKLMKRQDQWLREIKIRGLLGGLRQDDAVESSVVPITRCHPDMGVNPIVDSPGLGMPLEIELDLASSGRPEASAETALTKEQAESLYCLVMPLADRNMFVALKQDTWAGKGIDEWRHIFVEIAMAVRSLHQRGVLHADLKALNLVRKNKWAIIDLDASCRLGPEGDNIGFKSSTSIMPPEAIFFGQGQGKEGGVVCVRSEANDALHRCGTVRAHPSFDVWSLGCLLYQMGNPEVRPLFQCGKDDNLSVDDEDEDNIARLAEWSDATKARKLAKVADASLRNLLSIMLVKDPAQRPTLDRVLAHPVLSGLHSSRMGGETAPYDLFLSYRDKADRSTAEQLYRLLTARGLKVWWDKVCLQLGDDWELGFTSGLVASRCFLALISRDAINHSSDPTQSFALLSEDAPKCDNVLLEHRLALELQGLGYMNLVCPVFRGDEQPDGSYSDFFSDGSNPPLLQLPNVAVDVVERKLTEHMERECLGTPLVPRRTVRSTFEAITKVQGLKLQGKGEGALADAADVIAARVMSRGAALPQTLLSSPGSESRKQERRDTIPLPIEDTIDPSARSAASDTGQSELEALREQVARMERQSQQHLEALRRQEQLVARLLQAKEPWSRMK